MNLLILCILSIITVFYMQTSIVLRLLKDVCIAGYKVDLDKLSEIEIGNEYNFSGLLFVPFLSIVLSLVLAAKYKEISEDILDYFDILGILEELNLEEKNSFLKKPSTFNALLICGELI